MTTNEKGKAFGAYVQALQDVDLVSEGMTMGATIDHFDELVRTQQPASVPWAPVTDYSAPAREAIEGQHPRLILETFALEAHQRILDVGCGFGHLVNMLNDLAGRTIARGCDIDNRQADFRLDIALNYGRTLAHDADLVICREVLEHLTVRQIRQAVTNLCALSSRYLYVTTRFHPNPTSLLDVATSDDLDPTHISMLPQDLLRALFVMEGFTRRADFEEKLDWQRKGRVLVYERW